MEILKRIFFDVSLAYEPGLRSTSEQCWSTHNNVLLYKSSILAVETEALKDSINGSNNILNWFYYIKETNLLKFIHILWVNSSRYVRKKGYNPEFPVFLRAHTYIFVKHLFYLAGSMSRNWSTRCRKHRLTITTRIISWNIQDYLIYVGNCQSWVVLN